MSKFFIDKSAVKIDNITITGADVSHIKKVLRMTKGDRLTICDGEGTDYFCIIDSVESDKVVCCIEKSEKCMSEPKTRLTLFQCIPKSGKMDMIIQKAVELGAYSIVPVLSHRCVAKGEKVERWQKIAAEAVKQCGRGIIPQIMPAEDIKTAIGHLAQCDLALMPYEAAKDGSINSLISGDIGSVGVIIGPEGGFEESEVALAEKSGVKIVTLGKRILRTETAGSAVIAIVMNALGEMC